MPDPPQKNDPIWLSKGKKERADVADPRPEKTSSLGDAVERYFSGIGRAAEEAAKEQPKSLIDSLLKVLGQNPGLLLGRGIGLGRGGRGSILKPQVGAISKKPTLGALAVRRGAPGSKKLTAAPAAPAASLQPVDPMPLQHESLAGRRVAGPPSPEEGRRDAVIRAFSADRRSFKELDIKVSKPKLSIEIDPSTWISKKAGRSQSGIVHRDSNTSRSYRLKIAADVSDKESRHEEFPENLEAKNIPLMVANIEYDPTRRLLYVSSTRPTDYGLFLFGKLTDDQYAEGLRRHKDRTMARYSAIGHIHRELDSWGTAEARGADLLKTLLGFESSRDVQAHIATTMRRYEPDAMFIGGHRLAGMRAPKTGRPDRSETRFFYLPKALKETWKGYEAKPGWRSEIAKAKKGGPGSLAELLQKGAGDEKWMDSIRSFLRDNSLSRERIWHQEKLDPGVDLSTMPEDVLEGLRAKKFLDSKDLFGSWEDLLKDPRTDQLFPKGSAKRTELDHLIAAKRAKDWSALGNMELFAPEAAADSPFDYEQERLLQREAARADRIRGISRHATQRHSHRANAIRLEEGRLPTTLEQLDIDYPFPPGWDLPPREMGESAAAWRSRIDAAARGSTVVEVLNAAREGRRLQQPIREISRYREKLAEKMSQGLGYYTRHLPSARAASYEDFLDQAMVKFDLDRDDAGELLALYPRLSPYTGIAIRDELVMPNIQFNETTEEWRERVLRRMESELDRRLYEMEEDEP